MRLVGKIKGDKEAHAFYSFLQKEEIECLCEASEDPQTKELTFSIWVASEDDLEMAEHWLLEFQKDPTDPRFYVGVPPIDQVKEEKVSEKQEKIVPVRSSLRRRPATPITFWIILFCVFLFILNLFQLATLSKEKSGARILGLTPLFVACSYDYPKSFDLLIQFFNSHPIEKPQDLENLTGAAKLEWEKIEKAPSWDGFYEVVLKWPESKDDLKAPMFQKIKQGQVWRFFTPCFLHGNFLHILFNMLWLWFLGRQVELRTKKWQYLSVSLIVGVVSNTAQYLMSGPLFIGYSGIICGLAGYIWIRQKRAPWEGYPLQRATVIFLTVFIVGMLGLQIISFILIRFQIANFPLNIANTAHIVGALTGIALGRIPLFTKGGI
jgi:GlpG protein